MDSIEKYALFSGHSYDKNDQGAAHSANVTMITGTAMSDSTDGVVSVDFGGNTISADDEQAVDVSTTCAVKEGDTVQVSVVGADGTAKSLLVTGVIAGGDRIAKEVDGASTAASEAKQSASDAQNAADTAQNAADTAKANAAAAQSTADKAVTNAAAAQSTADTANSTANTTKTYFYNDGSGSHVVSKNSTSAGTRADVKTDGMHIVDQDDGKELASFTSSGAAIGKDSEIHTKYSTDGIDFYEKNKSYPFTRINPVSIEKEKYSAASISSSPSDITDAAVMDDGFWHSSGAVSTSAVDGTSTDNNGWARAALVASTVQSNNSNSASVEVFASNSNPNKGIGGVGGDVDNYINMTADEVYINNTSLLNKFFPIGKLWISTDPTSPASIVGGSWEQIKDGVLFSAGHVYKKWEYLCDENASFTLTETSQVRYGRYDTYTYKTLSAGTYTANSALFGGDPYPGGTKVVDIYKSYSINAGDTGGEVVHELSQEEMPFHNHKIMTNQTSTWHKPGYANTTWLFYPNNGTYANKQSTGNGNTPTWTGFAGGTVNNGNKPHNNMMPYRAVYMWRRIA